MSFRRSPLMRAVIKRLPPRTKRWLRVGRRWQRLAVARLNSRWHRSLQFRVFSTTLVLSVLVIAVLGFFLVQSIAAGLLHAAEKSAVTQVDNGRQSAEAQTADTQTAGPQDGQPQNAEPRTAGPQNGQAEDGQAQDRQAENPEPQASQPQAARSGGVSGLRSDDGTSARNGPADGDSPGLG